MSTIDQIDGGDTMNSEEYAQAASQIVTQQAVALELKLILELKLQEQQVSALLDLALELE